MQEDEVLEEERIADEQAADLGSALLTNHIRALRLHLPVRVQKDASVREAVRRMMRNRVGCVIIEEEQRMVGILTERDILTKVVSHRLDPIRTPVETVMTRDPETLSPDVPIAYALNKMSVGGFRHVPLVDETGSTVGVVAMRDIVNYIVDLFPKEVLNLPPEPGLNIARTREGA